MRSLPAALALLALLLPACGPAKQVARDIFQAPPKRTELQKEQYRRAVKNGTVLIGMTRSEVRAARGRPKRTDSVRRFGGVRVRRWIYAWDEIYFDDRGFVIGTAAAYR